MRAKPSPTLAIDVQELGFFYGAKKALDGVSFALAPGEFLALLGPNGSGKTTLFSLLTRLLRANTGSIELFGYPIQRAPAAALSKLGVVFQQPTLDLDLTVGQNLAYHGALQGMGRRQVARRAEEELARFDLSNRVDERVRALNGGHRRRVEVARALLHEPDVLLLDEASTGLDFQTRQALYRHVRELCGERNIAVLWTTHLVEELASEDPTLLLHNGTVRARDTIGALADLHGQGDINRALSSLLSNPDTTASPRADSGALS